MIDPGLATRLFSLLNCSEIDGINDRLYLEADWSVECHVGEHSMMTIFGIAFLIIYIIGIPLVMFILLFKNRRALYNEEHPNHKDVVFEYGGLYLSCNLSARLV